MVVFIVVHRNCKPIRLALLFPLEHIHCTTQGGACQEVSLPWDFLRGSFGAPLPLDILIVSYLGDFVKRFFKFL